MAKRTCYTCGNTYNYCPSCEGDRLKPKWMNNWDSEECKDVFNVLNNYDGENVKVSDVKAVFKKYGVKDFSKYKPGIQAHIAKILKTPEKKSATVSEAEA